MQVILEGPDGIGKSTLSNYIIEKYGLDYIHNKPSDPNTLEYYITQIKKDNLVMDRSGLSELIYSSVYNRNCRMPLDDQITFFKAYKDIYIIYYATNFNDLKERLEQRGDTDQVKSNLQSLNELYKLLGQFLSLKFSNIYLLDISLIKTQNDVINYFEKIKGEMYE